jgi:hypothetical protein
MSEVKLQSQLLRRHGDATGIRGEGMKVESHFPLLGHLRGCCPTAIIPLLTSMPPVSCSPIPFVTAPRSEMASSKEPDAVRRPSDHLAGSNSPSLYFSTTGR